MQPAAPALLAVSSHKSVDTTVAPRQAGQVRRWALRAAIIAVGLAVLGTVAGGVWVEQRALHLSRSDPYSIRVLAVGTGRVTLSRTGSSTNLGRYRVEWPGGWGVVSDIVQRDGHRVVRAFTAGGGSPLETGAGVRLESLYRGDPHTALGVAFTDARLPSPIGPLPVWVIDGSAPTWAIAVHGYGGSRQDDLQWVPALHGAGVPIILLSYRNDLGAPRGPGGLVHFGQTEWRDVDPAVTYARAHGARRVILIGQSMGGAIVTEYVRHSSQAQLVGGLVLDAPALDLGTDMRFGAQTHGLGGPLNWLIIGAGRLAMRVRAGIDFADLDEIAHAKDFHVPILLYQGDATPWSPSRAPTLWPGPDQT
jgi:pimeloyl-ACP methyl ester carboxylesterase